MSENNLQNKIIKDNNVDCAKGTGAISSIIFMIIASVLMIILAHYLGN